MFDNIDVDEIIIVGPPENTTVVDPPSNSDDATFQYIALGSGIFAVTTAGYFTSKTIKKKD